MSGGALTLKTLGNGHRLYTAFDRISRRTMRRRPSRPQSRSCRLPRTNTTPPPPTPSRRRRKFDRYWFWLFHHIWQAEKHIYTHVIADFRTLIGEFRRSLGRFGFHPAVRFCAKFTPIKTHETRRSSNPEKLGKLIDGPTRNKTFVVKHIIKFFSF